MVQEDTSFSSFSNVLLIVSQFIQIQSSSVVSLSFEILLIPSYDIAELDGISDLPGKHSYRSMVIGKMGPYIPYPSHSTLSYLGPQTALLMLDCRYADVSLFINSWTHDVIIIVLSVKRIKFVVPVNMTKFSNA